MPNIQALKRRIQSAKNIKQITKAMEMVAASKMRRAQAQALASRPFARKLDTTLKTIASLTDPSQHPLLQEHHEGKNVILLVSTDKSLAGSLNTNLFRGTEEYLESNGVEDPHFILVGQKARGYVVSSGYTLLAEFNNMPDPITYQETLPISSMIMEGFLNHEYHSVTVIYMDFISTLVQKVRADVLFPFSSVYTQGTAADQVGISRDRATYIFEPNAEAILNWILPYYVQLVVYQTFLEARASEHSARMVSMKNASDNATEIIADLTLSYNKQRQAKITTEIIDNTTAALIVS